MDGFFKINYYPSYLFSLFNPSYPLFCLGFHVDMVSYLRLDFFVFFSLLINSPTTLAFCLHGILFNAMKIT